MEETQTRQAVESLFLEHLPRIEKIVAFISAKHGIRGADAEDFASLVKLKLIENDYLILRKFRNESSLTTYLAVVIAGLYRDYRVQRWGRWRPSAAAKSYGDDAVKLETLVFRDGCTVSEAVERVTPQSSRTEKELRALMAKLPVRERLRPVEVSSDVVSLEVDETAQAEAVDAGDIDERSRIEDSLNAAIDNLPPEDRAILKMKFWGGMSVADISRIAGTPQKHLYRRIDKLGALLKGQLRRAGVTQGDVQELIRG